MKRAAIRHPKSKRLARELGIPLPHALGLLVMLWDFTGEYAAQGDIGKFSDEDIAGACEWPEGDAAKLIQALTSCGWLDDDAEHRLVVHDWSDHCEQFVEKRLKRAGLAFIGGNGRLDTDSRRLDTDSLPGPARPGLAKPSHSPARPAAGQTTATAEPDNRTETDGVFLKGIAETGPTGTGQKMPTYHGQADTRKWASAVWYHLAVALRLDSPIKVNEQRASVLAVVDQVAQRPDRDTFADDMIRIAREKLESTRLRKPIAAWQTWATSELGLR